MFDTGTQPSEPRKYYGKYPAVVIDASPGEGAHLGKVKVRVFGILEEDDNGQPRAMEVIALPCLPPGFFFVPERDTHVWVEFAAGDIDTPIWVGVWYANDEPPDTADGQDPTAKTKIIRTAAGHVVTLDDDGGKIVIKDKNDNTVTMDSGGVTLNVGAGGIKLVGADASQLFGLLMERQEVTQYLMAHQHSLGNMGASTGPPLPPPVMTPPWFTSTVKGQ